jgi:type VI secretion system protein ImpC
LLGCSSLAATPDPRDWNQSVAAEDREAWAALRQSEAAAFVGLALPRFLLRLPYGKQTVPVEGLAFEEMPSNSAHESYLWGNPACACACVLGEAFLREGWDFQPEAVQELNGLPLHIYSEDGESRMKPCAEVLLGDRATARILEAGLIPVLSVQGSDRIRLPAFRPLWRR